MKFLGKDHYERHILTLPAQIPDEERKLTEIFIFTLLCGTSGFMKAFKAFIKPLEAPPSVKMKIQINFYFNTTL